MPTDLLRDLSAAQEQLMHARADLLLLRRKCEAVISSARRDDAVTVVVDGFDYDSLTDTLATLERDGAKVAAKEAA